MSFLNPVSEPVQRFSSKDAGAPQINYNARVPGDVKTVLKACLVTGYGAKQSAGWSIANEIDHVAEFVSPSAAMSDYRLGIDDTSAASTTWYYQYQDVRTNPTSNSVKRSHNSINKTSADNGWQLLVTQRGMMLVEIVKSSMVSELVARVTCFGSVKSALKTHTTHNIAFWSAGYNAPAITTSEFLSADQTAKRHYRIETYDMVQFGAANLNHFTRTSNSEPDTTSAVEIVAELYIYSTGYLIAQQPGLLLRDNNTTALYGVYDTVFNERPVLSVCLGWDIASVDFQRRMSRTVLMPLDYWEY